MRNFVKYLSLCLLTLPIPVVASDVPDIVLSLVPTECFPGDVVALQARMSHPSLATFTLKVPNHASLHLVAHQTEPVTYSAGVYSQVDMWILQPTEAGTIEMDGLLAIIKQGDFIFKQELSVLRLEVESYGAVPDSPAPQPLPVANAKQSRLPLWRFIVIITGSLVGILSLLFLAYRKNNPPLAAASHPEPTLDDLRVALEGDTLPIALMEQLLAGENAGLSTAVRRAIERATYGGSTDKAALLQCIHEEDPS